MDLLDFFKIRGSVRNDNKIPTNNSNIGSNIELEQSLKRTMERYRCVSAVLEQHGKPCTYEFHTTSKGVPVIMCLNESNTEIKIYNLNNNEDAVYRLKLVA